MNMELLIGQKLAEDNWFIQNILPYVFGWLNPQDLLRCSMVCKSWHIMALEPRFWRSVTFEGCLLNFNQMAGFLYTQKTSHLKLIDCLYMLNNSLIEAIKLLTDLKKLELSATTLTLIEQLPEGNPNFQVIRANVICGFMGTNLSLSFLKRLPHLYELKLYCDRSLNDVSESLNLCKKLRHLSLVGVKNLCTLDLWECKIGEYGVLKSLALGDCLNLPNSVGDAFIKSMTNLEELRLENCRDCHIADILNSISTLRYLRKLELIEINADLNFAQTLSLCKQIKHLVVVPNPHRFYMACYNHRIFLGATSLRDSLERFTWGFIPRYLLYISKTLDQKNCVPYARASFASNDTGLYITLDELNCLVRKEMKNTDVRIECKEYTGDVFL